MEIRDLAGNLSTLCEALGFRTALREHNGSISPDSGARQKTLSIRIVDVKFEDS